MGKIGQDKDTRMEKNVQLLNELPKKLDDLLIDSCDPKCDRATVAPHTNIWNGHRMGKSSYYHFDL
jgi:hypothetical protein